MKDSIFQSGHNVSPLVGWLLSQMDDSSVLEKRLRGALLQHGVEARHWRGIMALDSEANTSITKVLEEALKREKQLAVLAMLGRCDLPNGELGASQLEDLTEVLGALSPDQFNSAAARIVREWLLGQSIKDPDELNCVLRWWLSSGSRKAPKGHWPVLLRQTAGSFSWPLPMDFPAAIDGVAIRPLADGQSLIEEGAQMGNCLESGSVFNYAQNAMQGKALFFHLHKISSPLTCATLSIELEDDRGWSVGEFETVGRGSPPDALSRVARQLVASLNEHDGYPTASEDDLEDDFLGDIFVRRHRRRRVRRPQAI